jgi:hypothetical protein
MRPGRLEWIGVRPGRKIAAEPLRSATLVAEHGIEGDRYETGRNGPRQVALIASEDISAYRRVPRDARNRTGASAS